MYILSYIRYFSFSNQSAVMFLFGFDRGSPENVNGAPNDRRNDYVYNDDRALLKVDSC